MALPERSTLFRDQVCNRVLGMLQVEEYERVVKSVIILVI